MRSNKLVLASVLQSTVPTGIAIGAFSISLRPRGQDLSCDSCGDCDPKPSPNNGWIGDYCQSIGEVEWCVLASIIGSAKNGVDTIDPASLSVT